MLKYVTHMVECFPQIIVEPIRYSKHKIDRNFSWLTHRSIVTPNTRVNIDLGNGCLHRVMSILISRRMKYFCADISEPLSGIVEYWSTV